jgi:hypothetical protein
MPRSRFWALLVFDSSKFFSIISTPFPVYLAAFRGVLKSLEKKRKLKRSIPNLTTIYREGKGKTIVQRDDKGVSPNSPKRGWK